MVVTKNQTSLKELHFLIPCFWINIQKNRMKLTIIPTLEFLHLFWDEFPLHPHNWQLYNDWFPEPTIPPGTDAKKVGNLREIESPNNHSLLLKCLWITEYESG